MGEWRYCSTVVVLGFRRRWVISLSQGIIPLYLLYKRLCESRSRSGHCRKEISEYPAISGACRLVLSNHCNVGYVALIPYWPHPTAQNWDRHWGSANILSNGLAGCSSTSLDLSTISRHHAEVKTGGATSLYFLTSSWHDAYSSPGRTLPVLYL
jgi:hypothetical protein